MQIVIDIPKEDFEVMEHNVAVNNPLCPLSKEEMVTIVANGTPLLEGATNGDIIKTMFPYAIKSNYIESSCGIGDYVTIYLGDYEMRVSYDWWNTSYKTDKEQ